MKASKSIFCCYTRSSDILDKLPIQETSPDPLDIIYDNCPVEGEPRKCINNEPKQFTMFVKYMGDRTSVIKDKPPKTDGPERPSFYNKFMKASKSIFCCYTRSSDILDKLPIQETSPDPLDIIYDNCPVEGEPRKCINNEPKQFTMFVKYMGDRTSVIKDEPPKTDGPERPSFYKNKFMKASKSIFCCYTRSSDILDKLPIQETSPDPLDIIYDNCPVEGEPRKCINNEPKQFTMFVKYMGDRTSVIKDEPPKTDGPERPSFYNKFMKALKSIFCCYTRSSDKKGEKDSEYLIIKKIPVGVGANIDFPDILDKLPIQETSPDPLDIIYDNCPVEDEPKQFTMFVKYMGDRTSVIKDKPPKTDGPERPSFYKNKFMKDKKGEKDSEYLIIKIPVGVGANIDFPDELLSVPIQETGYIEEPGEQDLSSDTSGVTL
ncbi:uncharacterized protein LOC121008391 [Bufo bufo]|uniref:uncharacterized protein LOC121008391 n=1 Tax=Bufo bufo TaxID=8384 RepID=UPI001ABDF97F|nr:uncharacterized protein LOC121008391 [Bufo bufo]